tara:strand:- start:802 stop:1221 length:420 start_codon:yes stop_codon:yes gene_type:complete
MKKSELKSLIKECVKEVIFEEGVLSGVIAEVAFGLTKAQSIISESNQSQTVSPRENEALLERQRAEEEEMSRKRLLETKRRMLDAVGSKHTKNVNVFEGTLPAQESSVPSPLSGYASDDAGVDISGLFSVAGKKWKALK